METFNHTTFTLIHSLAGHAAWQDALGIAIGEYLPYLFIAVEVYLKGTSNNRSYPQHLQLLPRQGTLLKA